jgi:hypothetical protein
MKKAASKDAALIIVKPKGLAVGLFLGGFLPPRPAMVHGERKIAMLQRIGLALVGTGLALILMVVAVLMTDGLTPGRIAAAGSCRRSAPWGFLPRLPRGP